jgi:hypothetical protein
MHFSDMWSRAGTSSPDVDPRQPSLGVTVNLSDGGLWRDRWRSPWR